MLTITVPPTEIWDERTERMLKFKGQTIQMEHSLISLSKWEQKYCKVFLGNKDITEEELRYYFKCMTITPNVDDLCYLSLTSANISEIINYIDAPMSATFIKDSPNQKKSREPVTSELIYYWMIEGTVPVEFEKWHLNRLLTLIKVIGLKRTPPKKRSKNEILASNRALNEARKAQWNTKG